MGSLPLHEPPARDRLQPVARPAGPIHSRRLHQRPLYRAAPPRSALAVQPSPTLADAPVGALDAGAFAQSVGPVVARATRVAGFRPTAQPASHTRRSHPQRVSRRCRRLRIAADQRSDSPTVDPNRRPLAKRHRAHRRHRSARRLQRFQKKDTGTYTAARAALGGRTLKTGQNRWFVGYKKHSFRLWWREYSPAVLLVPLVSWIAPANVSEGGLLVPSLHYCD